MSENPRKSAWQVVRFWLRQNLRAALWILAIGLVLGALTGYSLYLDVLQAPLTEPGQNRHAAASVGRSWT